MAWNADNEASKLKVVASMYSQLPSFLPSFHMQDLCLRPASLLPLAKIICLLRSQWTPKNAGPKNFAGAQRLSRRGGSFSNCGCLSHYLVLPDSGRA